MGQNAVGNVVGRMTPATVVDGQILREQLAREPRAVVGVGARCVCGRPTVVVTAPRLEDGSPFPTTYYLTCPSAVRACSVLEADHVMEVLQRWVDEDPVAGEAYRRAHVDYIERRGQIGRAVGVGDVPEIRGVSAGGMPIRVKCLHALVGHALAVGPGINPVGDRTLEILEKRGLWSAQRCSC